MSERSTHHATFVIERTCAASLARVFKAWADEHGTRALLDNLDAALRRETAKETKR